MCVGNAAHPLGPPLGDTSKAFGTALTASAQWWEAFLQICAHTMELLHHVTRKVAHIVL